MRKGTERYDIYCDGVWTTNVDSLHAAIGYCEHCNANPQRRGVFTYRREAQTRLVGSKQKTLTGELIEEDIAEINREFKGVERIMALEWSGYL